MSFLLMLADKKKDFADHEQAAQGPFLELLPALWEIVFALGGSYIDGKYSFPRGTKVNNSGRKWESSGFQDHLAYSPDV